MLCTNQFELYTDFGIQIKARSKAVQTFVVQLTNGAAGLTLADIEGEKGKNIKSGYSGTYLPSERAKKGGGNGAVIQSNIVGPEGGQILDEETLKMIDKGVSITSGEDHALETTVRSVKHPARRGGIAVAAGPFGRDGEGRFA